MDKNAVTALSIAMTLAAYALVRALYLRYKHPLLNVVALAPDLAQARLRVQEALPEVQWPGMQYRHDIGLRALNHAVAGRTVQDSFA